MVAAYSGVAPEVIAKMSRFVDPEYVEPQNLQPVIDLLAKYGTISLLSFCSIAHPNGTSPKGPVSSAAWKPIMQGAWVDTKT